MELYCLGGKAWTLFSSERFCASEKEMKLQNHDMQLLKEDFSLCRIVSFWWGKQNTEAETVKGKGAKSENGSANSGWQVSSTFYIIVTICYKVFSRGNNWMLSLQTKTEVKLRRNWGRLKLLKVTQETGRTKRNLILSIAVFLFFKILLTMCWTHTWKEAEHLFVSLSTGLMWDLRYNPVFWISWNKW